MLIYRYFDGLPSLLSTFAQDGDYWITIEELIGDPTTAEDASLADWMIQLLTRLLQDLQERPVTQEILRWELLEANELTHELATVRDRTALATLDFLEQQCSFPTNQDIPAISAVLVAGIVYLVLRTKISNTFMGIDFSSPTGWQRIEAAAASLIRATVEKDQGRMTN